MTIFRSPMGRIRVKWHETVLLKNGPIGMWLAENDIKYSAYPVDGWVYFETDEDAMAFKLRWA